MSTEGIENALRASIAVKQAMLGDPRLIESIQCVADELVHAFRNDRKVLLCGNGGSAADAQHIAAELSGRFGIDRRPLFAVALHGNTSHLTAVANDQGFAEVYSRLVAAMGRPGDVLIAISTSGNSPNVLNALTSARASGMLCVGLAGRGGGRMRGACDHLIEVPSTETPRIQEAHIVIGHILCHLVESALFG
jgi:D-sedoheptulose 7-phosphate isomerase